MVVANHQSQVDIPLLFSYLPMPVRFLAKRGLFYIPVFGWAMWLAHFIPVDRGKSKKSRRSVDRAAEMIAGGPSLVVFPEGTRSPDGQVHKFKSGAFVMAIKAGVPVLPVALLGTYAILPKSRLETRPGPVEMIVGSPISTDEMTNSDRNALRRKAQEAVLTMLETKEPL